MSTSGNQNNAAYVSAAKPAVAGAISVAPKGTTVPTTAEGQLDSGFKAMGYVSDDGVTNANSPTVETVKAWGGDTVLVTSSEKPDTFKYTLLEVLNYQVLKYVYGAENVSGSLDSGISIKANNAVQPEYVIVIDMVMRGGILHRIVIPNGSISEVGEITYKDNEAAGYETTVTCIPDSEGNTHYEYFKAASTT